MRDERALAIRLAPRAFALAAAGKDRELTAGLRFRGHQRDASTLQTIGALASRSESWNFRLYALDP